ncbi:MAG: cell division protein FtsQ/DivIB [Candidatus Omnitrophica bacterium]|nr:cell division protein FtsQ/DivIB [Candidatus Omnitrophota bacterium]
MVKIKRQKVRFRRRKPEGAHRPSNLNVKSLVWFLIALLFVGGIGAGLVSLKYLFLESGYFLVKSVDVKLRDAAGSERSLSLAEIEGDKIVGSNIFSIDLNEFRDKVEKAHTEFKDVVVKRVLPGRLMIEAEMREPIAQIRSDRYYFVDAEGVLLPDVKNFPDPDLPVIFGIGINLAKVKPYNFTSLEREGVDKALSIITGIRNIESLKELKIKSVDVTDSGNLSFFLERSNVEIKIGNSDFNKRLMVLETLLEQVISDIDNFKYIDLRFEDPIIGPK